MEKEPRIYIYRKGLFWDYKRHEEDFNNKYFDNEPWRIKEYWNVSLRLRRKLWESEDIYYDGHTVRSWVLLGVELSFGYSYDSRSIKRWMEES